MGERIKQLWAGIRAFFAGLSLRVKILLGVVLLASIAIIAALVVRASNRPYSVLFTDLSTQDLTNVVSFLETNQITDYKVENNNRILVRSEQADRLRMQVMLEAYPTSGYGYEMYLTNVSSLSSDSDRRILWQADLQDRLAASIRTLDGVRDAQVYITAGEDRRYILSTDDVIDAEASVMVTMSGTRTLDEKQANAIRALVTRAVQGLQIENVDIVDSNGNSYFSTDGSISSGSDSAALKLYLESQTNAQVRNGVLRLVEDMFGAENVSVTVNSTVDVSRRFEESTVYENPDWADEAASGEGIIGRRLWGNSLVRDEDTTTGGVVGTTTNADLNEYVVNQANLDGSERAISTSGEIDFNVTEHHIQSEMPVGVVTDIMVAVAINSLNVELPNTEVLTQLVARAAGIDPELEGDKIAIMVYPFYTPPPEPVPEPSVNLFGYEVPTWVILALVAGIILFVILIITIILIRRALIRRAERRRAEREAEEARRAALEAQAAAEAEAAKYNIEYEELAEGEEPAPDEEIVEQDGKRMRVKKTLKPQPVEEQAPE